MSGPRSAGDLDLCVVGNLLIDIVIKGVPALPAWGTEVLGSGRSHDVGGQGANLARAAVALGLATSVVSVVGRDSDGLRVRETLDRDGVGTDAVEVADGDTALAVAAVRPDGERAFLTDLACSEALSGELLGRHWPLLRGARATALVGTSNLPGLDAPAIAAALTEVRRAGGLSIFDPGWQGAAAPPADQRAADRILGQVDVFLPNRDEASALTGEHRLDEMLRALGDRCPGTVIVKCGYEGSALLRDGELVAVEALPVAVDSAVGAGDVFDAGVISGLLEGADPVAAAVRGTAAASLYISRASSRFDTIGGWRERAAEVTVRGH